MYWSSATAPAWWSIPCRSASWHGSELDFVDDLIGAQFKLNNPNVTAVVRLRHQLLGLTVASLLRVPLRHGRACPGHPSFASSALQKFVDARHKAGHDEGVGLR